MTLKNQFAKWGWKAAAAGTGLLVLIVIVLAVVLPKKQSSLIISTAMDAQKKLSDNAKEHEVRIAVAKTKRDANKRELEERLEKIDTMPSSMDRRKALIEMHKEIM